MDSCTHSCTKPQDQCHEVAERPQHPPSLPVAKWHQLLQACGGRGPWLKATSSPNFSLLQGGDLACQLPNWPLHYVAHHPDPIHSP